MRRFDRRVWLNLILGFCAVGFFVADVVTPTCFREPFPALLSLGVVTAQLTVISVWGTLVRGSLFVRLPWTLLLLVLSWCGFALGIQLENGRTDVDAMLQTSLTWMFGFVTSFVPLKIAAFCFGWQIIQDQGVDQNKFKRSRYTISDLMLGTLLLAVSLGVIRAILPDGPINFARVLKASFFSQSDALMMISIYGIVSLLVKLPCIWIALGEKREKIPFKIAIWIFYCFALAIVEIVLLNFFLGSPGNEATELYAGIIVCHQVMGASMLFVCLVLREMGYRMERSFRISE